MLDQRLIEADATKLDELHEIMLQQEHPEKLHDIDMKAILIDHGAVAGLNDAVRSLWNGQRHFPERSSTAPTYRSNTARMGSRSLMVSRS